MSGIISALFVSTLAIFVYAGFFRLKRKIPHFESGIRKLLYHARVMSLSWLILLPLFFIVCNYLAVNGLFWLFSTGPAGKITLAFYGVTVMGICFFFYMVVYYVVDRSVSSRMMIEIERSAQKRMTFEEIKAMYDIDKKYQDEIDGMLQGGFLRQDGRHYHCTSKGAVLARVAIFIKRSLSLGAGG